MISFILNNKSIKTDLPAGSTLLDFIRYQKRLTGTKIGCREGDCGACTVLIGELREDKLKYLSMTSCLTPLSNIQGKHVLTVEGIEMEFLSPAQQLLIEQNGTQCGFCTLGFVMSLTGFMMDGKSRSKEEAIAAIDGNICRCTGYKSIERSIDELCKLLENKPQENSTQWLVEKRYLPNYLIGIKDRLKELYGSPIEVHSNGKLNAIPMGGGTDLMVQRPEQIRHAALDRFFDEQKLKGIQENASTCSLGASTTVTEFAESPVIQSYFPDLSQYIKLISSTPIRNMATMAGNIINASPIGDMSIFLLGLDASLILKEGENRREIKLKDFFLDYKKLDKRKEEYIYSIEFKTPATGSQFNFEKVSKRTHLDIASVNSACQWKLDSEKRIVWIHLSAGGVGPTPKYLKETCQFLEGKKIEDECLAQALEIMRSEISPISDARGSADYKAFLLRQLFLAHLLKFMGPLAPLKKVLSL